MMRVLHLTHYGDLYGANRSLLDLVDGLRGHGVASAVAMARDGALRTRLTALGVPCAVVPFHPWMQRRLYMGGPHHRFVQWWRHRNDILARERANAVATEEVVRFARGHAADLVHVHSAVIGLGAPVARKLGVPYVQQVRELHRAHYGYTVDGGDRRLVRALRGAAAVVAISHAVREELRRLAGRDLAVEVVPNGVVTRERWQTLQAMAADRWAVVHPFRFALLGLFHPSKGQLDALEALARLRAQGVDARLVLAGGGNDAAVRERIRALGLEGTVELPGFVDDPFAVLLRAHALLNCSRHEAMGRTTWEAMACGLPVIGHASGATPELVHHERTGLLYRTAGELAAHMQRLATKPAEAQRMGLAACRSLPEAATVEAMCGRMAQLYCRIMGRVQP